jgi:uncharacterized OsmC-like protein
MLGFSRNLPSILGFRASKLVLRDAHTSAVVIVTTDCSKDSSPFRQVVKINGKHTIISDEPLSLGGLDLGPAPYPLLMSALGTCTTMTIQMYAARKKLPLDKVEVTLKHEKIDVREDSEKIVKADKFERNISLYGQLTDEERHRMIEIANKCPVHRTLHQGRNVIVTNLV